MNKFQFYLKLFRRVNISLAYVERRTKEKAMENFFYIYVDIKVVRRIFGEKFIYIPAISCYYLYIYI